MKINIYLPYLPYSPGGGVKVMYEYANQFISRGHDVIIYHIYTCDYESYIYPHWMRTLKNNIRFHNFRPTWYELDDKIVCRNAPRLKDCYVRDADISFSTCWTLTFALNNLSYSKGKKINLVQDYEVWIGNNVEKLNESYRLPIRHVVIADYLADILEKESGNRPPIVYNGINHSIFKITVPIENRNPHTVSMLYSQEERKGTKYGLEALILCKKEMPDLHVELFGVYPKPENLEEWIHYTQKPQNLAALYNSTAIYFTPSNGEGWALPPAEALNCGCALVCTDIGGHSVYAKDKKTALLTEPKNSQNMSEKLLVLLKDDKRRRAIAKQGNEFVQQFSWSVASDKILTIFSDGDN